MTYIVRNKNNQPKANLRTYIAIKTHTNQNKNSKKTTRFSRYIPRSASFRNHCFRSGRWTFPEFFWRFLPFWFVLLAQVILIIYNSAGIYIYPTYFNLVISLAGRSTLLYSANHIQSRKNKRLAEWKQN